MSALSSKMFHLYWNGHPFATMWFSGNAGSLADLDELMVGLPSKHGYGHVQFSKGVNGEGGQINAYNLDSSFPDMDVTMGFVGNVAQPPEGLKGDLQAIGFSG
ncbi:hypothetical protein LPJ61_001319 [Coemansia biformis]|uniref:Uncharacterized protein n=1 Tax=Coemansia biformis TaxID=1286918 RepID=A0A9W8CXE4_9FUNG|nr:hypothetical protein LPJ61_001319 [Coemansia biformis]